MGVTIREKNKGSGQWAVFVCRNGRRKSKLVGPKKDAEAVARRIRAEIAAGHFGLKKKEKPTPKFKEVAANWFKLVETNPELSPKTIGRYEGVMRLHILPIFGDRLITEITRAEVMDHLAAGRQEHSVPGLELQLVVLNGVFGRALSEGLIQALPTVNIKKDLRLRRKRPEPNPLGIDEVEKLLKTVQEHFQKDEFLYPLLYTAFRSGLRMGEALGLQWEDIDLEQKQLHVQRSWDDLRFRLPKHQKIRVVDMPDSLVAMFRDHRLNAKKKSLQTRRPIPEVLFDNGFGRPLQQNKVRRAWTKALQKAGIEYHKFHSTRATYASHLLSLGADIYYVSQQLGHHSVKITEAMYAKYVPVEGRTPQAQLLDAPNRTQASQSKNNHVI